MTRNTTTRTNDATASTATTAAAAGERFATTAIDATVINYYYYDTHCMCTKWYGPCVARTLPNVFTTFYTHFNFVRPARTPSASNISNFCRKLQRRRMKRSKLKFIMIMISGIFLAWSSTVDSMIEYGNHFLHGIRVMPNVPSTNNFNFTCKWVFACVYAEHPSRCQHVRFAPT